MSKKVEVKFIEGFGASVVIKDITFNQLVTALENDPHAGTIFDAENNPIFKIRLSQEGAGSLSSAGAILTPSMRIRLADDTASFDEVKEAFLIPVYNLQLVLDNIVTSVEAIEEELKDVFKEVTVNE